MLKTTVRIIECRHDIIGCRTAARSVVSGVAFVTTPAVVFPTTTAGRLEIDLFPHALPDITDPQVSGFTIEAEPPGVAEAKRPYFIQNVIVTNKGIGRW